MTNVHLLMFMTLISPPSLAQENIAVVKKVATWIPGKVKAGSPPPQMYRCAEVTHAMFQSRRLNNEKIFCVDDLLREVCAIRTAVKENNKIVLKWTKAPDKELMNAGFIKQVRLGGDDPLLPSEILMELRKFCASNGVLDRLMIENEKTIKELAEEKTKSEAALPELMKAEETAFAALRKNCSDSCRMAVFGEIADAEKCKQDGLEPSEDYCQHLGEALKVADWKTTKAQKGIFKPGACSDQFLNTSFIGHEQCAEFQTWKDAHLAYESAIQDYRLVRARKWAYADSVPNCSKLKTRFNYSTCNPELLKKAKASCVDRMDFISKKCSKVPKKKMKACREKRSYY